MRRKLGRTTVPWIDANGISIHYALAGQGPSVALLHEMGGTLDSWDGIFPALSDRFRTLRYDQRGSGLSEKVRQITTELLVGDLEAVLQGSGLPPPYHLVTVAAATMQALI
jgi:3-oxoadipate enol-lactonase